MDVLDLNEFAFRFTPRFYPFSAFRSLLGIAGGAESPTFAELYPANGRTLHVVGVCVNRIGTQPSSNFKKKHSIHSLKRAKYFVTNA